MPRLPTLRRSNRVANALNNHTHPVADIMHSHYFVEYQALTEVYQTLLQDYIHCKEELDKAMAMHADLTINYNNLQYDYAVSTRELDSLRTRHWNMFVCYRGIKNKYDQLKMAVRQLQSSPTSEVSESTQSTPQN